MSTKERHLLIAKLLGDPTLTDRERGQIARCSSKTVQRVRREIERELESDETVQDRYREYQRHIRRYLPAEFRAKRLRELAEQDDQKMVALKAIQYGDENDGFVTAKAQRKTPEPVAPGPMFIFPVNSRPILTVTPPDAPKAIEIETVQIEEDEDN